MSQWTDYDSATCSVARTAALVGDAWTVLVLRDLFNGVRRFDDLADHLGIARNVLTRRLAALVEGGLVTKTPYREPGRRERHEYRLTPAGKDLRVVVTALKDWGDAHLAGEAGPPLVTRHAGCGGEVHAEIRCAEGHLIDDRTKLIAEPGPGARLRSA
ncbi:winged helix-turn-helix transcriptional regulator [Pseudonocardia pini]|uniref:winged helix-turn-helix transcriptional regulator n=1 Tax=Pseudonocardia pini TaxID=2758030 RepID=UPI0015F0A0BD|nr:helix-turn-helix domain-containing protein [Pseudonocardia pini]